MDEKLIISLPKIELHTHVDCSLSFEAVSRLVPDISLETFREKYQVPADCQSLQEYLAVAAASIALMQTQKGLEVVLEELFKDLDRDHVIYAEIRLAPLIHTQKDLGAEDVVRIISDKVELLQEKHDIRVNIILCALRSYTEAQSLETVQLIDSEKYPLVVGFDLAGNESGYPLDAHVAAYDYARKNKINCTAHAGESEGGDSVIESIEKLGVSRIGHGITSIHDSEVLTLLKEKNIHLEICPISNLYTKVVSDMPHHPINELYKKDISVSINTDARGMLDTSLVKEYDALIKTFGWKEQQFIHCNLEALRHAFLSEEEKEAMRKKYMTLLKQA